MGFPLLVRRIYINMSSYQYRKYHCRDKTVVRLSYIHNGISYTGKTTSLYWIRAMDADIMLPSSRMISDVKKILWARSCVYPKTVYDWLSLTCLVSSDKKSFRILCSPNSNWHHTGNRHKTWTGDFSAFHMVLNNSIHHSWTPNYSHYIRFLRSVGGEWPYLFI